MKKPKLTMLLTWVFILANLSLLLILQHQNRQAEVRFMFVAKQLADALERREPTMPRLERLESGAVTLIIADFVQTPSDGRFLQKGAEIFLRKCAELPWAWYCHPDLFDRVQLREGPAKTALVVDRLTMPEAMSLCSHLWTSTAEGPDPWAQQAGRTCRFARDDEFN